MDQPQLAWILFCSFDCRQGPDSFDSMIEAMEIALNWIETHTEVF